MEVLKIVLLTLIFGLIFFNILNNKKLSFVSFMMFICICMYYYLQYTENTIYVQIYNKISNLDFYLTIFIVLVFIITMVEYIIGYKSYQRKNSVVISDKKEEVNPQDNNIIITHDKFRIYLDMFNEPIALLDEDKYILNNEMKKILKYNSNNIEKKKLYAFVHNADKNVIMNNSAEENIRINVNGNFEWFEIINIDLESKNYSLIKKSNHNKLIKMKLKSFKEMINIIDSQEKNQDYYLVMFNINNYNDLNNFYGQDFMDLVLSKHLNNVCSLSYVNSEKVFYISKNEYILLIDNILDYNILISELENNSSILIKNDIIISDNKVVVKGKVGAIASSNVESKNSSYVINKGLELLKLASDEDYNLDYAIFHEADTNIEYTLRDLDIDLSFDFTKYKKRIQ